MALPVSKASASRRNFEVVICLPCPETECALPIRRKDVCSRPNRRNRRIALNNFGKQSECQNAGVAELGAESKQAPGAIPAER